MKVKSLRSILVVAALSFSVTASDDPMAPSFELGDISIPLLPAGSGKFALSGNWCPWFLPDLEGIAIYPSVILVPSCGDDTFNKIQMLQSL
ncbi:MAG: hypothetical protein LBE97_00790, partial [Holosporales bacterium]|nr:hypothetical protein [Holosporales bacterium]